MAADDGVADRYEVGSLAGSDLRGGDPPVGSALGGGVFEGLPHGDVECARSLGPSARRLQLVGVGSARLIALRELRRLGSEGCQVSAAHFVQQLGPLDTGGTHDLAQLQAAQAGGYNVVR